MLPLYTKQTRRKFDPMDGRVRGLPFVVIAEQYNLSLISNREGKPLCPPIHAQSTMR
jgi:hypothetical protein